MEFIRKANVRTSERIKRRNRAKAKRVADRMRCKRAKAKRVAVNTERMSLYTPRKRDFAPIDVSSESGELPPCLVINLDRARDRMAFVSSELSGVIYDRVSGVDGHIELSDSRGIRVGPHLLRFSTKLSPGQCGCLASHLKCWDRIVETGKTTLVCEDDVLVKPGLLEHVAALAAAPPYEIMFFSYHPDWPLGVAPGDGEWASAGAVAYMATPAGARILVRAATKGVLTRPVDHFMLEKVPELTGIVGGGLISHRPGYSYVTEMHHGSGAPITWPPPAGSVLYINLAHRTDRRQEIEDELRKVAWPIERLDATKAENGAVGCSLSHARALNELYRRGHSYGIVLEDDAVLDLRSNSAIMRAMREARFDVFLLGTNHAQSTPGSLGFRRVTSSQTLTGYLVKRACMPILIRCFRESARELAAGVPPNQCAADMKWKSLMRSNVFLANRFPLAYQRPSHSDIQNRHVDYQSCRRGLE